MSRLLCHRLQRRSVVPLGGLVVLLLVCALLDGVACHATKLSLLVAVNWGAAVDD